MDGPFRAVRPVGGGVKTLRQAPGVHGRFIFGRVDMHFSLWKVRQTAGVIEVEMGQYDVADVLPGKAQPGYLPYGTISS